jgi:hypothetical protein
LIIGEHWCPNVAIALAVIPIRRCWHRRAAKGAAAPAESIAVLVRFTRRTPDDRRETAVNACSSCFWQEKNRSLPVADAIFRSVKNRNARTARSSCTRAMIRNGCNIINMKIIEMQINRRSLWALSGDQL